MLEQFYVEVYEEDGEEYKTGSLINITTAINRYLRSNGRNINILNEREFTQASNLAFTAKQADLKREGYAMGTLRVTLQLMKMTLKFEMFEIGFGVRVWNIWNVDLKFELNSSICYWNFDKFVLFENGFWAVLIGNRTLDNSNHSWEVSLYFFPR